MSGPTAPKDPVAKNVDFILLETKKYFQEYNRMVEGYNLYI